VVICPGFAKDLLQVRKGTVLAFDQLYFDLTEATDNPPAIKNADLIQDDIRHAAIAVRDPNTLPLRSKCGDFFQRFVPEMSHQQFL
jgi:hypothetical protein